MHPANENPVTDKPNPTAPTAGQRPPMRWIDSIRFRLVIGLLVLLVILTGSGMALIWLRAMPMLVEQRHELNGRIGESLVRSLLQHFSQAEAVSRALARLVEALPRDDNLIHKTIPPVLDNIELNKLIVGGGIWPEPHRFNPANERNSFFWDRNPDGQLQFLNGYNEPEGAGYHHEEWYVPAKLQGNRQSYWSRSYTDPYSLQPMVTCTTPFFFDGVFAGVSTVDLKLEGVHALVQQTFQQQSGYAFVVDRNNKFIAFPDMSLVITARQDDKEKPHQDYIYTSELALQYPVFAPLADQLNLLNLHGETRANREREAVKQLAAAIAADSYQIDQQEARVIAHNLQAEPNNNLTILTHFRAQDDLLLRQPVDVAVYEMPRTHWKIVTVFPVAEATRAARDISTTLSWLTMGGIIVWGALLLLFVWKVFFRRLQYMTSQVMLAAREDRELALEHATEDELGQFAFWYNLRTQQLHQALEQAREVTQKLSDENREHQLTAALLQKSLAMQHAILDSANLIIVSTDTSGIILACNAGTRKLLGYSEQDLIGKTFPHRLIETAQLQEYADHLQSRFNISVSGFSLFTTAPEQGTREENEWQFIRKDGSRCHILLSVTPVLNPSHQLEGWLAVGSDITERKQAEESLKAAKLMAESTSRAKTNFLANMSHELRTPLNAVLGFTRRLQKKLVSRIDERNMDALDTIERSANHLMALINDLLDISKIEAGQMDLQLTEFNLGDLIAEVHEDTRTLAEGRPLNYGYQLPRHPVALQADRKKIKQVLYNLISNALKATEHGSIDIQLSEPHADGQVSILVTDTGKGISPDDSRKLFQKFRNLDTYVDGKASTGLGLYLTLQLVKLHQGNISFESTPGKGTCFTVTLPLQHKAQDAG